MARAWLDGHYSPSQIGEHFGCGRSTVNRAVKAFRGKWETSYLESASSNQDASSDEAARSAEADET